MVIGAAGQCPTPIQTHVTGHHANLPSRTRRFFIAVPLTIVLLGGFLLVPAAVVTAGYRTVEARWETYPTDIDVSVPLAQRSTVLDANGDVIATFYAENRVPVTLEQVPQFFLNALISTEDARFYQHHGVDWYATARAVYNNLTGGPRQGGSGITQQYVKTFLVLQAQTQSDRDAAQELTLDRKIREARLALALETRMSKEEILTGYLNAVYFGDGAYGVGAAAQHYFHKTPMELTEGEQALLVGVINNPSAYDPTNDLPAALDRREHVLNRMVDAGTLAASDAARIAAEPVTLDLVTPANGCVASPYPQYCQQVRDILQNDPAFGATPQDREEFLYRGGLTITTALDPDIQRKAEESLRAALPATGDVATAMAIVQPGTGHVLALAQNRPFGQKKNKGQTELVYATRPAFQNGSTFKPFTAITALEQGVSPNIVIDAGSAYIPAGRNYPEGGFHNDGDGPGATTDMAGALRNSINTWFVELEDRVGVRAVAETAYRLGMTSLPMAGPGAITEKDAALTLGVYETSPLNVANSYATIAAHGKACPPVFITSVTRAGQDLPIPDSACTQVIRADTADTVTGMLQGVVAAGTGLRAQLPDGRPQAGKTGTTNNFGAAWFVGYVPQMAAAVWVGDPRGPDHGLANVTVYGKETFPYVYGGTAPAVIWRETMSRILKGMPKEPFARPGGDTSLAGTATVPEVRGYPVDIAYRILLNAGYVPEISDTLASNPNLEPGTVSVTQPNAGAAAPVGSTVTLLLNTSGDSP